MDELWEIGRCYCIVWSEFRHKRTEIFISRIAECILPRAQIISLGPGWKDVTDGVGLLSSIVVIYIQGAWYGRSATVIRILIMGLLNANDIARYSDR
jgi:hypothetical protein